MLRPCRPSTSSATSLSDSTTLPLTVMRVTVKRAAANCAARGASMFTVHAAGGRAMLEAAVEGALEGTTGEPPRVVAVTVLTSLDASELTELDLPADTAGLVGAWARLARDSGVDGVVASAREAARIRQECGDDFLIVTPGIRPASSSADDQRRVVTPAEAIRAGADVLVVGRPITTADDPVATVTAIRQEMEGIA